MKIALNVTYILDVDDRFDFWDKDTRLLGNDVKNSIIDMFPENVNLSHGIKGRRLGYSHIPLKENVNCVKCSACGRYLSISKNLYLGLNRPAVFNGKILCESCKWELS